MFHFSVVLKPMIQSSFGKYRPSISRLVIHGQFAGFFLVGNVQVLLIPVKEA